MLRRLAPLAVSAVLATGLVTLGAPAHAASVTVEDARKDVVEGSSGEPAQPGSDAEPKSDIVRSTLVHGAERIRIEVEVRNLRARSGIDEKPEAYSYLRTSERGKFSLQRVESPDGENLEVRNERTDEVACRGTTHQRPAKNLIVQTLPRDCVGDPDWLRFGLFVLTQRVDESLGAYDDARRTGGPVEFPPAIGGPRVLAGQP